MRPSAQQRQRRRPRPVSAHLTMIMVMKVVLLPSLFFHGSTTAFQSTTLSSSRINNNLVLLYMSSPIKEEDENFGFGESVLRKTWVPTRDGRAPDQNEPPQAPVYITIGPPCGGKTRALRQQLEQDGYNPDAVLLEDVALDEQSDVYQRVPLAAFLFPATRLDPQLGDTVLRSGITVRERLCQPSPPVERTDVELRNVILRVAGRITDQEFADRTRELALQAGDTVKFFRDRRMEVAEDLMEAVERVSVQAVGEILFQMQQQQENEQAQQSLLTTEDTKGNELPYHDEDEEPSSTDEETQNLTAAINATSAHLLSARALIGTPYVELYVPHAIFSGGIDRAETQLQQLLKRLPPSVPVSWGNTNTRPVEYATALRAAQRAGRPVQFIAWGVSPFLPRVPRHELLRGTVSKFRKSGRYIPAGAVGAALGRVEWLIKEAEKEIVKLGLTSPSNKVDKVDQEKTMDSEQLAEDDKSITEMLDRERKMNIALAALAGFAMDEDGRVTRIGEPRSLNQQFRAKKKPKTNRSRTVEPTKNSSKKVQA